EFLPVVAGVWFGERQISCKRLAILQQPAGPGLADYPLVPTADLLAKGNEVGAGLLRTRHQAGEMRFAIADDAAVQGLERTDLRRREAALLFLVGAALRQVGSRIEAALPRVVDQSVLQSVRGVAFVVDGLRDPLQLRRRNRRRAQRACLPNSHQDAVGEVEDRCSDHDAVEVAGKTLSRDQSLASAGR